jgi:hypothetical protein
LDEKSFQLPSLKERSTRRLRWHSVCLPTALRSAPLCLWTSAKLPRPCGCATCRPRLRTAAATHGELPSPTHGLVQLRAHRRREVPRGPAHARAAVPDTSSSSRTFVWTQRVTPTAMPPPLHLPLTGFAPAAASRPVEPLPTVVCASEAARSSCGGDREAHRGMAERSHLSLRLATRSPRASMGRRAPTATTAGAAESASRLLIIFVIMTMQFGQINAFNKMCASLKE